MILGCKTSKKTKQNQKKQKKQKKTKKTKKNKDLATSPDIREVVETLFFFFLFFFVFFLVRSGRSSRKEEVASQSGLDDCAVRVKDFVVRVSQQTADMGCLVYQMIRPTYTGCCERKKKHETIHSIKAIYPQKFFFLALTTPLSE